MEQCPPLLRVTHQSDHGTWTSVRRAPIPRLAPYVVELQGYRESGGPAVVRKETPVPFVPVILVLGTGFTLHDPRDPSRVRALERSFVAGLHDSYSLVGSRGDALCLQIDLTPLGARRLLGPALAELAGQVVDLDAVLGDIVADWEDRLSAIKAWPARFSLLEKLLLQEIETTPESDPLVATACQAMAASGGAIRIGSLAETLGCSRKHLTASFRREFGVAPKAFARVLRFGQAVQSLQGEDSCALAELAQACGYADQAHFTREFRSFAGETPASLRARSRPPANGVIL